MMSVAAEVEVPEPSPLFWDHLSARVGEAVAAEQAPRRSWIERAVVDAAGDAIGLRGRAAAPRFRGVELAPDARTRN